MKVAVLIYHNVIYPGFNNTISGSNRYYSVDIEEFERQLTYLSENRLKSISLNNWNWMPPAKRAVVLTFDDGLISHYACFRLLCHFGFVATFFVVTDWIGTDGYLNWDQLKEMDEKGMNIQSHTCSHPFLTELKPERIQYELKDSKQKIEERLGKSVDSVSIPQGFVSSDIIRIAQDCKYKYIFTSDPGVHDTDSGFIVRRLSIFNHTTISEFKRLVNLNFFEIQKQIICKNLLLVPKALLGTKNYHTLHTKILSLIK